MLEEEGEDIAEKRREIREDHCDGKEKKRGETYSVYRKRRRGGTQVIKMHEFLLAGAAAR